MSLAIIAHDLLHKINAACASLDLDGRRVPLAVHCLPFQARDVPSPSFSYSIHILIGAGSCFGLRPPVRCTHLCDRWNARLIRQKEHVPARWRRFRFFWNLRMEMTEILRLERQIHNALSRLA